MTFQSALDPSTERSEAALSACMERLGGVPAGTDKHGNTGVSGGYNNQARSGRPEAAQDRARSGPRRAQNQAVEP